MARIFIWNSSWEAIKENWAFGVGTGDSNEALLRSFEKNNLYAFFQMGIDGHNQYLETEMALGIPGVLTLALLTFGLAVFALVKRNILLFAFAGIFILLFTVESFLRYQYGSLCFAFFSLMLIKANAASEDEEF